MDVPSVVPGDRASLVDIGPDRTGRHDDRDGRLGQRRSSGPWMATGVALAVLVALAACVVGTLVRGRLRRAALEPRMELAASPAVNLWTYPFRTGDLVLMRERAPSHRQKRGHGGRDGNRQARSAECCGMGVRAQPAVQWLTGSCYHHTGVAYVDPRTGQTFVWELNERSTRLASLYDLARECPPRCAAVRPLRSARGIPAAAFEAAMRRQWRATFDYGVAAVWCARQWIDSVGIVRRALDGRGARSRASAARRPRVDERIDDRGRSGRAEGAPALERTCVHLTTDLYAQLGILDMDASVLDPRHVFVADYAADSVDQSVLPMAAGCDFGPILLLDHEPLSGGAPDPLLCCQLAARPT